MPDRADRSLHVAILARSVHPLHGVGGLERHVYDLVRHLIARDVHVTLITKPLNADSMASAASGAAAADAAVLARDDAAAGVADGDGLTDVEIGGDAASMTPVAQAWQAAQAAQSMRAPHAPQPANIADSSATTGAASEESARAAEALGVPADRLRLIVVPYVTFPGAGRRGTTVADRVTAYPFFGWRAGRVAAKLAYCGDIDLVYALGASGLGYAMARRRHVPTKPFVFNPQGLEEFGGTNPEHARLKRIAYGPLQSAVRTCARAADAVIATDRALVPTLLRHLPIDRDHIDVVPNGIDLRDVDRWRGQGAGEALRARLGMPREAPLLVSVGRLEANKGFHVLAQALGLLLSRQQQQQQQPLPQQQPPQGPLARAQAADTTPSAMTDSTPGATPGVERGAASGAASGHGSTGAPGTARALAPAPALARATEDWRWVLVGDGPFRQEIERAAAAAGLGSRMIVAGRVPDAELHGWYEAADVFVHPTLYEGSSLVTLEAMAHGRAVIATRAGGLPDKVTPGDNGWLVDPNRPDQLAEAVLQAMHASPAARAAMGRASRARVAQDFAWPVIADRMIDVYRRLIAAEERS
jgi:glycosyltransferase involved in cell wall biosynthesis